MLQLINSERFMASSLSSFASEGIHKMDTVIKNMKFSELNIRIATVFLNTQTLRIT